MTLNKHVNMIMMISHASILMYDFVYFYMNMIKYDDNSKPPNCWAILTKKVNLTAPSFSARSVRKETPLRFQSGNPAYQLINLWVDPEMH